MIALPTTTHGLRARSDRLGGGGTCSGSSAARGLLGEIGGLSLIDATSILSVHGRRESSNIAGLQSTAIGSGASRTADRTGCNIEYGETVNAIHHSASIGYTPNDH
jgi:hypothetical protein